VALRVVVSMWNSIGTFMLHGKFPILRAWFSLVGGFCYAVAIPVVTVNLHRFFETDGGRVNGHGAALLSSYFSHSTLFWSITMPAWILLVVLAFWSAMALFFIFSSPLLGGNDSGYGKRDLVAQKVEARTSATAEWLTMEQFVVPGLNSTELARITAEVEADLVVPLEVMMFWVADAVFGYLVLMIGLWPFFTSLPVFIWNSLLQAERQRASTADCVQMVTAATTTTDEERLALLEKLGERLDANAIEMEVLNAHLSKCGACVALSGLLGMVGFVLDLIVPVEGTGGLPLGFRLPIVLSCTTLFFWVLGTASKPSMAWHSFLAAFKSPRIAGRLHCSSEYSWTGCIFPSR
jgi:hypothetical protein